MDKSFFFELKYLPAMLTSKIIFVICVLHFHVHFQVKDRVGHEVTKVTLQLLLLVGDRVHDQLLLVHRNIYHAVPFLLLRWWWFKSTEIA